MATYGQLVAGVVHEVRQPLFALKTAAFLLEASLGAEAKVASHVGTVRNESRRLETLMDDLLEFAKPMKMTIAPVDVASVLGEALEAFRAQAPSSLLRTEAKCRGSLRAPLDRSRMVQVLLNLLHNADRHARGVQRVLLDARPEAAGGVTLEVENDGSPMAKEIVSRIFDPFFTTGKGAGLGLAISRRIVEAHGGKLSVTPLDVGTRFTIAVPPIAQPA
jgi:signal transduction histidine kinase